MCALFVQLSGNSCKGRLPDAWADAKVRLGPGLSEAAQDRQPWWHDPAECTAGTIKAKLLLQRLCPRLRLAVAPPAG